MKNVCIVIPVYKVVPNEYEIISLEQCIKTLSKHPIIFIAPDSLDCSYYEKICLGKIKFQVERFDDIYFEGIPGYNRLMLSKKFYQRFTGYNFILIHQPDVFIFRDELEMWCNKGYDYIGAPWVDKLGEIDQEQLGGNGGLSLRNVKAHIKTLSRFKIEDSFKKIFDHYKKFQTGINLILRLPLIPMRLLGYKNNSRYFINGYDSNEDGFWSKHAGRINKSFKLAPVSAEIAFAFEKEPKRLFIKNNKQLPFGCHAWEKYDLDFWKPFIEQCGYKL